MAPQTAQTGTTPRATTAVRRAQRSRAWRGTRAADGQAERSARAHVDQQTSQAPRAGQATGPSAPARRGGGPVDGVAERGSGHGDGLRPRDRHGREDDQDGRDDREAAGRACGLAGGRPARATPRPCRRAARCGRGPSAAHHPGGPGASTEVAQDEVEGAGPGPRDDGHAGLSRACASRGSARAGAGARPGRRRVGDSGGLGNHGRSRAGSTSPWPSPAAACRR